MIDLKSRDFISISDFSPEELNYIVNLALHLEAEWRSGIKHRPLEGKTVALLFKKHSTRTRASFQAATARLGAQAFFMTPETMQLARGEPIADTIRVLDRYMDAIVIRTFEQKEVLECGEYARNPVINALTNQEHPTQILADIMTIKEKKNRLDGVKLVYTGVLWNVPNSLMLACPKFGIDLTIAVPAGYSPNKDFWKLGLEEVDYYGTKLEITHDLKEAVKGADVVYALTWYAMGQSEETIKKQMRDFKEHGFTVTPEVMKLAKRDAVFMHCLPAHRGEEVVDEVIDGPQSVVWDQAENKLHIAKALLASVI